MKKSVSDVQLLSIIVPAYKEERVIVEGLRKMITVLDSTRYDYEVIVVIDGILDKSLEILKRARLKNVHILAYKVNQGKWYAIRLGMKYAKGDHVMFIDGGMEIHPNGITMLVEHMRWYDADIVVGSKRHSASIVRYSGLRALFSYGYYYLVKLLFGIKVRDTQAGIKVIRRKVMKRILPRLLEKRFSGDLEVLVIAQMLGYRKIYEAPIRLDFELASLSNAATLRSIWRMFIETFAIFYRLQISHYYDRPHREFKEPKDLLKIAKPTPKR